MIFSRFNSISLQFSSVAQSCPILCNPMNCSTPGLPGHHQLPEFTQNSCLLSWWCHLIISSSIVSFFFCLQSFPTSGSFQISQFFVSGGQNIGVSASNEYPRLISFRMDWLDLLAVQGTLQSLLQHHSSKAWILWRSAFFIVQLSHPYMTTGKIIALIRWTVVGKVMSLLFNMLSMLVILFFQGESIF